MMRRALTIARPAMIRKMRLPICLALCAAAAAPAFAQPERPKILGVAHMAIYAKDLAKTRQFYERFLGFGEPFTLPQSNGEGVRIAFVKINDRQYVEIFTDPDRGQGQLNHISFYTDSADRMYAYLKSKRVAVMGDKGSVPKGRTGNKNFNVLDPDGHIVEIVEYEPDSWTARDAGKFQAASRISDHMMHMGVLVGDLEKSMRFYRDILGFREFWRGAAANGKTLSWVNMKVPDGEDYLEFMLYTKAPDPASRGTKNHISLTVPDAEKAVAELQKRAANGVYDRPIQIQTGINRRRQVNLYDPDGTRVELMEPTTIDGKPAPSSPLPAPKASN